MPASYFSVTGLEINKSIYLQWSRPDIEGKKLRRKLREEAEEGNHAFKLDHKSLRAHMVTVVKPVKMRVEAKSG
jgi:hypothetical protein